MEIKNIYDVQFVDLKCVSKLIFATRFNVALVSQCVTKQVRL